MAHLDVISSKSPAQAGPPSASCQQTHWAVFLAPNTWLSFAISLEKKRHLCLNLSWEKKF